MDRYWLWGPVHIQPGRPGCRRTIAIAKQAAGGEMPFRLSVALAAIGAFAGGILLQVTKEAVSAGDHKRDNHPVAFADRGDLGTRFHHFPINSWPKISP